MKYSFIIPTWNREYILAKAVDSILNQKGKHDFEILICDDGSADGTRKLMENFNNPRIKCLYQEHEGPCIARNKCLEKAEGEWIVYIDDDNTLMPEYLSVVEKNLNENPNTLYIIPRQERII